MPHHLPTVGGGVAGQPITDAQATQPFSAITLSDPDDTTLAVQVTVRAATGDLTPASTAGWARSVSGGTITYTEAFSAGTGSAPAAQSALQGLAFQATPHAVPLGSSEDDGFAVSVTDALGGVSNSLSGSDVLSPADDAPTLAGGSAQSVTDASTAMPFSAVTVSDPDNTSLTLSVTVQGGNGDLTAASTAGWSRSTPGGTITYTRAFAQGTASAAAAQAALQALVYRPTAHATPPDAATTVTFSAVAADALGAASGTVSVTDTITAVHDAPRVSGGTPAQPATAGSAVRPLAGVAVSDPDRVGLVARVTVAGGAAGSGSIGDAAGWTQQAQGRDLVLGRSFAYAPGVDAAVQAALGLLSFTPAHAGTTSFAVQVGDDAASPLVSEVTPRPACSPSPARPAWAAPRRRRPPPTRCRWRRSRPSASPTCSPTRRPSPSPWPAAS